MPLHSLCGCLEDAPQPGSPKLLSHGFVIFSVIVGALNGCLSIALIAQDALQEESAVQDRELEQGTVLAALAGAVKLVEEGTSSEMPPVLRDPGDRKRAPLAPVSPPGGPSPERLGRSMNDDMAMLVLGGIRWEEDRIPPHGHAVPKFRVLPERLRNDLHAMAEEMGRCPESVESIPDSPM
eukprot:g13924.t2